MKFLKEPLLHFVLIGAAFFGLFSIVNPGDDVRETDNIIVVPAGRIEQLAKIYAKTWQRPPTRDELEGVVDDFILEEIYYRKAINMGIDRDDTVIRRRLRQKVEFLSDDAAALIKPTDEELKKFVEENPEKFRKETSYSFQQVYINADKHADGGKADAEAKLSKILAGEDVASDSVLLAQVLDKADEREVDATFGKGFAEKLDDLEVGLWTGPVRSGLGYHLVKLGQRIPGEIPALEQIRPIAEREWSNLKRIEVGEAVYEGLRAEYNIVIEWPEKENSK